MGRIWLQPELQPSIFRKKTVGFSGEYPHTFNPFPNKKTKDSDDFHGIWFIYCIRYKSTVLTSVSQSGPMSEVPVLVHQQSEGHSPDIPKSKGDGSKPCLFHPFFLQQIGILTLNHKAPNPKKTQRAKHIFGSRLGRIVLDASQISVLKTQLFHHLYTIYL